MLLFTIYSTGFFIIVDRGYNNFEYLNFCENSLTYKINCNDIIE